LTKQRLGEFEWGFVNQKPIHDHHRHQHNHHLHYTYQLQWSSIVHRAIDDSIAHSPTPPLWLVPPQKPFPINIYQLVQQTNKETQVTYNSTIVQSCNNNQTNNRCNTTSLHTLTPTLYFYSITFSHGLLIYKINTTHLFWYGISVGFGLWLLFNQFSLGRVIMC
jgi:hypothetical protein